VVRSRQTQPQHAGNNAHKGLKEEAEHNNRFRRLSQHQSRLLSDQPACQQPRSLPPKPLLAVQSPLNRRNPRAKDKELAQAELKTRFPMLLNGGKRYQPIGRA